MSRPKRRHEPKRGRADLPRADRSPASSAPSRAERAAGEVNRGNELYALGRFDDAATRYRAALELDPEQVVAWSNLAAIEAQQGNCSEAESSLRRAIAIRPDHAEAWSNLGNVLRLLGRMDDAVSAYREAVRLDPGHARAWYNLGTTLTDQQRHAEAIPCYEAALRLQPDYVEAHENLGISLTMLKRPREALACYEETLRLQPNRARTRWNRAMCWLGLGDYERGWPEYEWRWGRQGLPQRTLPRPEWDGAPFSGQTVLLHAEQGLGDTLQFIRYAAQVRERGGKVVVACQRPLVRILNSVAGIDEVVARDEPLPEFDLHAPLLSLPRIFGTRLDSIPSRVPYLAVESELVARWRQELEPISGLRIGVSWAGNPKQPNDGNRSVPLARLAPLAELPGVHLISLQVGPGRDQIPQVANQWPLTDLGDRLDDFTTTAAVMKNLDLVIAVDSAVAHLAGALGVPVWVALSFAPDWRWFPESEESPWYPTARLFRQTSPRDWSSVFRQVADALTASRT
jgi:Flp pilus assembly protein TadD